MLDTTTLAIPNYLGHWLEDTRMPIQKYYHAKRDQCNRTWASDQVIRGEERLEKALGSNLIKQELKKGEKKKRECCDKCTSQVCTQFLNTIP